MVSLDGLLVDPMSDNISSISSMATVRYLGPTVVSLRGLGPMESKTE